MVLPQGDFAEFLHAEPRKRQEKLVRILGLGLYDVIARAANSEAAAGEAARRGADRAARRLRRRHRRGRAGRRGAGAGRWTGWPNGSGAAVPELAAAVAAQRSAAAAAERARAEQRLLRALTVPDGLDQLDGAGAAAGAAVPGGRRAGGRSRGRRRRPPGPELAAAPDRGRLEQLRRDHAELADRARPSVPGLVERAEKALADYELAVQDAADAQADLDRARTGREVAAGTLAAARELVRRLVAERAGFRACSRRPGWPSWTARLAAAADLDRGDAALAGAEAADTGPGPSWPPRLPGPAGRGSTRPRALVEVAGGAGSGGRGPGRRPGPERAAARTQMAAARHRLAARPVPSGRSGSADNLAAALRPTLAVGRRLPGVSRRRCPSCRRRCRPRTWRRPSER